MRAEEIKTDMYISSWPSDLAHEKWVKLPVSSAHPSARYKHAATVADEKLYINVGSRNGLYLSDIQVFDLRSLTWYSLKLKIDPSDDKSEDNGLQEVLPGISDHSMIKWENRLLLLGGNSKKSSDVMIVHFINLETHVCGVMETFGKTPVERGGHSVTVAGSKLIVFGGEDRSRKLLNDVHVFDLQTMTLSAVEAT
ncbi:putative AMP dependent CoA ligase [Hibiscus syriacus]|uniref:AMP dependent CoA ligase n=1 Tax=Hibiscus syriacus TaxID=106335 RepID=A0A6A3B3Q2_HIBSY|nr:putative AMP dependent CoA ligase [Hibiscus syriacus]